MVRLIAAVDPLEPAALAARRIAAIEYLSQAIFNDRRRGARLAKAVLAAVPLPDSALPEKKTA